MVQTNVSSLETFENKKNQQKNSSSIKAMKDVFDG